MTPASYFYERRIVELAVQPTAILAKKVLSSVNRGEFEKTDAASVTIADFATQVLLISIIRGAFPSDKFFGEESADALRGNLSLRQRIWDLVVSTHLNDSEVSLASPTSIKEMLEAIDIRRQRMGSPKSRILMLNPINQTVIFAAHRAVCPSFSRDRRWKREMWYTRMSKFEP